MLDPLLDFPVARIFRLEFDGNGVDVRGGGNAGVANAAVEGVLFEPGEQKLGPLRPTGLDHVIQRFEPFGGFAGIGVGSWRQRLV